LQPSADEQLESDDQLMGSIQPWTTRARRAVPLLELNIAVLTRAALARRDLSVPASAQ